MLLDFLGDVVCGGFGLPIARDMCQKVIIVGSNDLQSLYVANNVCSAVDYFRKLGGNVGVAGIVINKDDGTGEAHAFAEKVGIPVLASIPANEDIRRKSANYEIIGRPGGEWGPLFESPRAQCGRRAAAAPIPAGPGRPPRPVLGRCRRPRRGAGAGQPAKTCAVAPSSTGPRSKSSTTRCNAGMVNADRQTEPRREARGTAARRRRMSAACPAMPARTNCARPPKPQASRETLEQYAKDYPVGPHDQPQSMCPAFGCLRVGLRMRRTATILSGSACCVYGLTFTSHFYGARRTVGYVPFNSETLVTGKLFEDIRDAVFELAKPEDYDTIVITNLCVPTASGVPLQLLPKEINGVRIVGIDVPGFGVPTHAEAKDVLWPAPC